MVWLQLARTIDLASPALSYAPPDLRYAQFQPVQDVRSPGAVIMAPASSLMEPSWSVGGLRAVY
jgi:hypothetical protein